MRRCSLKVLERLAVFRILGLIFRRGCGRMGVVKVILQVVWGNSSAV